MKSLKVFKCGRREGQKLSVFGAITIEAIPPIFILNCLHPHNKKKKKKMYIYIYYFAIIMYTYFLWGRARLKVVHYLLYRSVNIVEI